MSKRSSRPYDPYSQKRNIRVPYTYLPRAAVKKQDRRFWGVGVPAIVLAFATILLAGIAQESASLTVKASLYRVAIPLCALTAAAFCIVFCFVIRKAYKEGWYCTYSTMERYQMERRLPVLRPSHSAKRIWPMSICNMVRIAVIGRMPKPYCCDPSIGNWIAANPPC